VHLTGLEVATRLRWAHSRLWGVLGYEADRHHASGPPQIDDPLRHPHLRALLSGIERVLDTAKGRVEVLVNDPADEGGAPVGPGDGSPAEAPGTTLLRRVSQALERFARLVETLPPIRVAPAGRGAEQSSPVGRIVLETLADVEGAVQTLLSIVRSPAPRGPAAAPRRRSPTFSTPELG
jgi:hypothetical protein